MRCLINVLVKVISKFPYFGIFNPSNAPFEQGIIGFCTSQLEKNGMFVMCDTDYTTLFVQCPDIKTISMHKIRHKTKLKSIQGI